MNEIQIKLENINKIYQPSSEVRFQALKDINLKISKGEFIAIMGPSGSGKSTLLNILGFLDRPSSGRYFFEGKDVSQKKSRELVALRRYKIGFIFQTFNLIPRLRVLENVEIPLIYQGLRPNMRRKRAKEVLEKLGLSKRMFYFPNKLSGGEQQRVAIARALVGGAEIILADEPTGNIDSRTGQSIMRLFQKINQEGKTIVLVTHDINMAQFAQRILYLKDGEIVKEEKYDL